MATIASDVAWGTAPVIHFNFTYSKQRSGTTQQYKIGIECKTIASSTGYFGYPIYFDISLDGTVVVDGYTLKAASPSDWTSAITYTSGWLGVNNKVAGTTALKIRMYSGMGSTRNTTYSYSLPVDLVPSTITATNADIETKSTIKITALSSTYQHSLAYMIDGQSSYTAIVDKTASTSYSWTVPKAAYSKITSGNSVGITIRCQTYSGSTLVGTKTTTMTATAAASTITATDANIEATSIVTINKKVSTFTHTLSYMLEGQSSYTIFASSVTDTSYGWKVPSNAYSLIPNGKSIDVTIRCQTYSSGTLVGTTTTTMTATTAEAKCKPTITVTASDTNTAMTALTGSNTKVVQGFSTLSATATAAVKNYAKITSITIKNEDQKKTATASPTSATFKAAENASVIATVTDSRGYSASATASGLSLVKYIPLSVNPEVKRVTPTGDSITITVKGNFFNATFGAVKNTLKLQYRYRVKGGSWSSLQNLAPSISDNLYSATATVTGFDYRQTYDIQVQASDAIYGVSQSIKNSTKTLPRGIPVFDWGENDFRFNVWQNSVGGNLLHNENLLDNWYFGAPINQRGVNRHTGRGYWLDRWFKYGDNATATLAGSEGITLSNTGTTTAGLIQCIENERLIAGETYTLSVLANISSATLSSGNPPFLLSWGNSGIDILESAYLSPELGVWQRATLTFTAETSGDFYNFRIRCQDRAGSVTVKAIKLERGEVSTLCYPMDNGEWGLLDNPPNPVMEIEKCQRYYVKFPSTYTAAGMVTNGALNYWIPVYLTVPMRAVPAVEGSPTWLARVAGGGYSAYGSSSIAFETTSVERFSGHTLVLINTVATAKDVNNSVLFFSITNLALNAELYGG